MATGTTVYDSARAVSTIDNALHGVLAFQEAVTPSLIGGRDVRQIVGDILDAALATLDWPRGIVLLANHDKRIFTTFARRGLVLEPSTPSALDAGELGEVLRTGTLQITALTDGTPLHAHGMLRGTAVVAPIFDGNDVIGLLAASDGRPFEPLPDQIAVLRSAAAFMAQVIARHDTPLGDGRTHDQILRSQRLESLGSLSGGVAHDFNNILGVILGYVELAKMNMNGTSGRVRRHLDLALSTIGRARSLADRLMEFANGGVRSKDTADLNEAVHEVRELLTETLDRRIEIVVHLSNDAPWIPLEHEHLTQLLLNLGVNASDAMPEGGRLIVDTLRHQVDIDDADETLAPGTYAVLRVRDTGGGIPGGLRDRIFDPYFTTKGARTGMGLWVVRDLVERVGGRIEVGGDENGTDIVVWFPSELLVPTDAGEPRSARMRSEGKTILIIDDEPGVREITRLYLEQAGFVVWEAATGSEGLAQLTRAPGRVALTLLDNHLPDAPGSEIAERITALEEPTRIVVVSGDSSGAATQRWPAGTLHLSKPFLSDALLEAVHATLQSSPAC